MAKPKNSVQKGDRYGYLVFQKRVHSGRDGQHARWLGIFKCDCGNVCEKRIDVVISGGNRSCGCKSRVKGYKERREKYGKDYGFYIVWNRFMKSAKQRGLEFDIKYQDIKNLYKKQEGKCIYTKAKLTVPTAFTNIKKPEVMSIDRIDPSRGYHKDNIQLVTKEINFMKYQMTHERFIEMCRLIAANAA